MSKKFIWDDRWRMIPDLLMHSGMFSAVTFAQREKKKKKVVFLFVTANASRLSTSAGSDIH